VQSTSLGVVANFQVTAANTYGTIRLTGNSRGGQLDFYNGATAQAAIWGNSSTLNFGVGPSSTQAMIIDSSGNVGIGTASPGTSFHLGAGGAFPVPRGGGSSFTPQAAITSATGVAGISVGVDGPGQNGRSALFLDDTNGVWGLSHTWGTTPRSFVLMHDTNERLRVDTAGRLLVGTSTSVVVAGAEAVQQIVGTPTSDRPIGLHWGGASIAAPYINFSKSRNATYGSYTIVNNGDGLGGLLFAGDDGTDYGSVGAAIEALVDGTPGANDMPGRLVFSTTADGASTPTERARITSAGDFYFAGITSAPTGAANGAAIINNGQLQTSRATTESTTHVVFYNTNGLVGSIGTSGSSTSYNTSSDYRLKENVTSVSDGITRLQQLKPSRFNFIADPAKTVDGFLAHEVQTIVPEAITGKKDAVDDDGNPEYQGIDQSKLVPLLTAALQDAIAKIESLEARLTAAGL
jgi:hypothetical protein